MSILQNLEDTEAIQEVIRARYLAFIRSSCAVKVPLSVHKSLFKTLMMELFSRLGSKHDIYIIIFSVIVMKKVRCIYIALSS
jgi:hypothetical protein